MSKSYGLRWAACPAAKRLQMLAVLGSLFLSACGGGGGGGTGCIVGCNGLDPGALPPLPPPDQTIAIGPVTTSQQARTLAARSVNAMLAYDNMNGEAIVASVGQLPIGPGFASGNYMASCSAGSGTVAFRDADANGAVSVGDVGTMAAHACQRDVAPTSLLDLGSHWVFDGTVQVSILGGSNVEQHLYSLAAGSAQLGVNYAGTAIGDSRTATGTYSLSVSNTVSGGPLDQTIAVPDLTIAHANVNLHVTGLSFSVLGAKSISAATGTFETSVAGMGSVQLALSVKAPLTVDASTTRFRPSAGTFTVTARDFSFEVEYGAAGAVTIRVDNGRDGSVDLTVVTTESVLDSLLTVP